MYTIKTTPEFGRWLDAVTDPVAEAAITARIFRASRGNLGNWRTVGDGVSEMKIDVGAGYRLYFTVRGRVVVVMLCGGDKSTQAKDIKRAKKIASEL
ncbi:type II toxin-antitoxin system RelE/ParE family toxin [Burkholderia gladioli]|uniref:type II toxin-antitoxin system RelE/ParE family toxin n=1 Tax=Burkholderia gladioli TaxID=28095 RepID=UPI00163F6AF9|nr:type II toxin-antitoxin system RelE/ParE family toxin [Burkholderia gladioli]